MTRKPAELTFCQTLCMLLVASQEMACCHWLTRGGNRSKCNHFRHTDPGFLLDTCQNMSEMEIVLNFTLAGSYPGMSTQIMTTLRVFLIVFSTYMSNL